jgi:hypothetical protein
MSLNTEPQLTPGNGNEQAGNAPGAPGATAPQPEVSPAVADFRRRFFTDSRYGLPLALGEEPKEYQQVMESLLLAPHVPPYQCFREGAAGNTARKRN